MSVKYALNSQEPVFERRTTAFQLAQGATRAIAEHSEVSYLGTWRGSLVRTATKTKIKQDVDGEDEMAMGLCSTSTSRWGSRGWTGEWSGLFGNGSGFERERSEIWSWTQAI